MADYTGPMVSHTQAQSLAQQRSAADKEKENAKRRARQPTDMNIPEGIEDIIIGNGVQEYKSMRDLERRLDAVTMRKKLDISDKIKSADLRRYRTLRIWISNTAENQPWQGRGLDENAFDFSTGIEATYRVKIEGRLLDDDDEGGVSEDDSDDEKDLGDSHGEKDGDTMEQDGEDTVERPTKPSTTSPRKRLSDFFKSITVDLERAKNLQPDGTTQIEWRKNTDPKTPSAQFDILEFERKSDENINCTIYLYRDENPERYQLSKELAEVVDATEATREHIKMAIWEYAKMMGLQQDEDMRFIQCDDRLRAVSPHTLPPKPSPITKINATSIPRSLNKTPSTSTRSTTPSSRTAPTFPPSPSPTPSASTPTTTPPPPPPSTTSSSPSPPRYKPNTSASSPSPPTYPLSNASPTSTPKSPSSCKRSCTPKPATLSSRAWRKTRRIFSGAGRPARSAIWRLSWGR